MSRELQAAFLRRLRSRTDEDARSCGGDTMGMISSARSLADAWIDQSWGRGFVPHDQTDNRTSSMPAIPAEALDATLREFWYSIVLAAKYSDSNGSQQQAIINLISEKKNDTGTLTRFISLDGKVVQGLAIDGDKPEVARTADGDVWSDLPYFRAELFDAFLSAPPLTSVEQWTNLHAFAARVTAAGLRDLSFYAIWALYDTLEVREMYPNPPEGQTSIVALDRFDPVIVWFRHSGSLLFQACRAGTIPPNQAHDEYSCRWKDDGAEFVGHLARDAGIQQSGFSMQRWAYWRSRLDAICDKTTTDTAMQATYSIALKLLEAMDKSEAAATLS